MKILIKCLALLSLSFAIVFVSFANEFSVSDIQLLTSKRLTRTNFEYQLQVTVQSESSESHQNVTASVSTTGTGTTIVSGELVLGELAPGSTASATLVIQQDRRFAFDPDLLSLIFSVPQAPVNTPPVAVAGSDVSDTNFKTITFDGSQSSDAEQSTASLTFNWQLISKPASSQAQLEGATTVTPSIDVDAKGDYRFTLTVTDGEGESATDDLLLSVVNTAPEADAGTDISHYPGFSLQLDGSFSQDLDLDNLSFDWQYLGDDPAAELSGSDTATPTFSTTRLGEHQLALTVNDGEESSVIDYLSVFVEPVPQLPDMTVESPTEHRFSAQNYLLAGDSAESFSCASSTAIVKTQTLAQCDMLFNPNNNDQGFSLGSHKVYFTLETSRGYTIEDEVVVYLMPKFAFWMERLGQDQNFANRPLSKIAMPASHDSGTYGINLNSPTSPDCTINGLSALLCTFPLTKPVILGWAVTQQDPVYNQLVSGIRYLDLRVCPLHANGKSEYYACHSLYGANVKEVFSHIREFLERAPNEVIFLDVHVFYAMSERDHNNFTEILNDYLGPWLFTKTDAENLEEVDGPHQASLNDFWQGTDNKRVILTYNIDNHNGEQTLDGHPKIGNFDTKKVSDEIWDKREILQDDYIETADVQVMIRKKHREFFTYPDIPLFGELAGEDAYLRKFPNDETTNREGKFLMTQMQATPGNFEIVMGAIGTPFPVSIPTTLLELNQAAFGPLKALLTGPWQNDNPNVLMSDFSSTSGLTELAIELNEKNLPETQDITFAVLSKLEIIDPIIPLPANPKEVFRTTAMCFIPYGNRQPALHLLVDNNQSLYCRDNNDQFNFLQVFDGKQGTRIRIFDSSLSDDPLNYVFQPEDDWIDIEILRDFDYKELSNFEFVDLPIEFNQTTGIPQVYAKDWVRDLTPGAESGTIYETGLDRESLPDVYEDEDWRVVRHGVENLNFKVSRIELFPTSPALSTIDVYDDASAEGELLCSILHDRSSDTSSHRFGENCDNDKADSLVLFNFKQGDVINIYDDADADTHDDWMQIKVKEDITRLVINNFLTDETASNLPVEILRNRNDGLEGRVSRINIGRVDEVSEFGPIIVFKDDAGGRGDVICQVNIRRELHAISFENHNQCDDNKADSMIVYNIEPGTRFMIADKPCTQNWKSDDYHTFEPFGFSRKVTVGSFEFRNSALNSYYYDRGNLNGKVGCLKFYEPGTDPDNIF